MYVPRISTQTHRANRRIGLGPASLVALCPLCAYSHIVGIVVLFCSRILIYVSITIQIPAISTVPMRFAEVACNIIRCDMPVQEIEPAHHHNCQY